MKRNFNVVQKDADGMAFVRARQKYDKDSGMPVYDEKGAIAFSHYEPMTLRLYALDALASRWKNEESMDSVTSEKRARLHDKLCFAPEGIVDLKTEDSTMILDAMKAQGVAHLIVGRMKMMLETDPPPAAAEVKPAEVASNA